MGAPVSNSRISGLGTARPGQRGAPAGAAGGSRKGVQFTVVQKADRKHDHGGHDPDAERFPDSARRPISQHAVVPEAPQPPPPPRELMKQLRQAEGILREPGFALAVREHARALLKGAPPPHNRFRRPASGVAKQFALKLAVSCAAAGLDTDSIAAVTPVEFDGEGIDDFRHRMAEVLTDREKFRETVDRIAPGLAGERREDFERQLHASHRMDSAQFAAFLREEQGLPSGYADTYRRAEELAEEEFAYRVTEEGMEAAAFLAQLPNRAAGIEVGELFARPVEQGERAPAFCDVVQLVRKSIPPGRLMQELPVAIAGLRTAMREELRAAGDQKPWLGQALATTWDARVVTTVQESVGLVADRTNAAIARVESGQDMKIDTEALFLGLLDILASGRAVPAQFGNLARELKVPAGTPAVVFLSQVAAFLRELDGRAFADDKQQPLLVKAVLDALDESIAQEEEMLEAGAP